jgi:hypothetical protein
VHWYGDIIIDDELIKIGSESISCVFSMGVISRDPDGVTRPGPKIMG